VTEPTQQQETRKRSRFRLQTFAALKYRDYRLLWFAQIGAALTQQSEMLTRSLLVIEITREEGGGMGNAALFIGLVHATRFIGGLALTPVMGVLADRVDRRYLLITANLVNGGFFLLVALLIITDQVALWHVVISATVAGAAQTMDLTSRQAMIPSLVPREGIMNGIALSSTLMGSSRIIGPAMTGFMVVYMGLEGAYLMTAAFVIFPVVLYFFMRPVRLQRDQPHLSFFKSFKEGFQFAIHEPSVRVVLLVGITVVTIAMPFLQLLPVYVEEVLQADAGTLGLIIAIPGFLTLIGGLIAASAGDYRRKGLMLFLAVSSPATAAVILSQTSMVWTAMLGVAVFAAFSSQYQPTTQTTVMKATPEHLRGRVASLLAMAQNLGSVGVIIWGVVMIPLGVQGTYLLFGVVALSLFITYFATIPAFRRLS